MKKILTKSEWEQVRTAYAGGAGLRELARNLGVNEFTVLARARRGKWTQQIEQAKAITAPPPSNALTGQGQGALTPADAAAMSLRDRAQRHVESVGKIIDIAMPHFATLPAASIIDRADELKKLDDVGRRAFGIRDNDPGANIMISVQMLGVHPDELRVEGRVIEAE